MNFNKSISERLGYSSPFNNSEIEDYKRISKNRIDSVIRQLDSIGTIECPIPFYLNFRIASSLYNIISDCSGLITKDTIIIQHEISEKNPLITGIDGIVRKVKGPKKEDVQIMIKKVTNPYISKISKKKMFKIKYGFGKFFGCYRTVVIGIDEFLDWDEVKILKDIPDVMLNIEDLDKFELEKKLKSYIGMIIKIESKDHKEKTDLIQLNKCYKMKNFIENQWTHIDNINDLIVELVFNCNYKKVKTALRNL